MNHLMNTVAVRPHPGGLVFLVQGLVLLASVILARSHLSPLCLQSRLVYKPVVSESIAKMCMPVVTVAYFYKRFWWCSRDSRRCGFCIGVRLALRGYISNKRLPNQVWNKLSAQPMVSRLETDSYSSPHPLSFGPSALYCFVKSLQRIRWTFRLNIAHS